MQIRRASSAYSLGAPAFSLDALVNAATRAGLQVNLLVTAPKRMGKRLAANS